MRPMKLSIFRYLTRIGAVFFLGFSLTSFGQQKLIGEEHHLFGEYSAILQKHLLVNPLESGGFESAFDYQNAVKDKDTLGMIKGQAERLAKFSIINLKTKNQAVSFWINAYNFFTIKKILIDGYDQKKDELVEGVKSFGHFLNPYKVFKLEEHNIGGKKYSLDQMEKSILLGKDYQTKGWKDAKVHFAVNCASVGCPPLVATVYNPENIAELLEKNVRAALKTDRHFQIKGKTLHLTHLFKWYKKDFEEESKTVKNFLKKYASKEVGKKIDLATDIEYIEYDWSLNRPSNFKGIKFRKPKFY